jgi:CHASE3 domain sensor protein
VDKVIPERFDVPIETLLRRSVTGGLIVAALLTLFLSFSSWRSVRRAEQDAYWISHTHEVMAMIQGTSRDVLGHGNQRAAFALSGQEPSLVLYQTAASRLLVFLQEER